MKNLSGVSLLCMVALVVVLLTAGCTLSSGGDVPPSPVPATTPLPPSTPAPAPCGFTTCHGTDLACGMDAPEVCTMEYRIGDRCREYARCDTSGGSCRLVTDPKFTACKACAERCQIQAGPNSQLALTCEEKC